MFKSDFARTLAAGLFTLVFSATAVGAAIAPGAQSPHSAVAATARLTA